MKCLKNVSDTMYYTVYLRYRESLRRDGKIQDERYRQIIGSIDYDVSQFEPVEEMSQLGIVCRTLIFDRITRHFIKNNPDGLVVSMGSGLDFRFDRVDNGRIRWIDIDLPDVIRLRQRLFSESDRQTSVSSSILDTSWMGEIPSGRDTLFIAEGLFVYFSPEEVKQVLADMAKRFSGAGMLLDVYSRYYLERLKKENPGSPMLKHIYDRVQWGINGWFEVENWDIGISFKDEWFQVDLYDERMPPKMAIAIDMFPWIRELSRIGLITFDNQCSNDQKDAIAFNPDYSVQLYNQLQHDYRIMEMLKFVT